ncbi:MAG: alanine--tRNA ligase, partial [Blastocatellia bacterium]|nr:alanine--tRNA ligase [Blastocatellia bacterium]
MSAYEGMTESQQFASRVIADHARSTAFAIADGILPGNEGRNYVLRKIMRRAIYHGREHLGLTDPFFYKVCDVVVDKFKGAFPELETQRDFIGKMVRLEEDRFGSTVTVGLGKLGELGISASTPKDDDLFRSIATLYDTFGTPRDLIRVFLEEKGLEFEEDDFNARFDSALQALQQQSDIGKTTRKSEISPVYAELLEKVGANVFHGYESTEVEGATVVALLDGDTQVDSIGEGKQGSVILNETPFYAESGGQVGDSGRLHTAAVAATVSDTYSPVAGLIIHKVTVEKGEMKVGDVVTAVVDAAKRDATRRNHTATHLVHAALKEVLGTHVKQAGSVVAPNFLRFDFAHYQPMTEAE